ncbi:MAG: HEPN domain-containing protein [Acidobacteria bacterium]|nr:HEPN domain-containing protein [Acidobacteriota bacterium]
MTRQRTPEDARFWLREADERLTHAGRYVADENPKILCEQAAYAAEFAIKGVIVARGVNFRFTHDIRALLEEAREAGERIPPELERAKQLTAYGGAGRYEFDGDPDAARVSKNDYDDALDAATATVRWAHERVERLLRKRDRPTGGAEG